MLNVLPQSRPEMSESEALSSAILDEMDVLEAFAPDTPPQVRLHRNLLYPKTQRSMQHSVVPHRSCAATRIASRKGRMEQKKAEWR